MSTKKYSYYVLHNINFSIYLSPEKISGLPGRSGRRLPEEKEKRTEKAGDEQERHRKRGARFANSRDLDDPGRNVLLQPRQIRQLVGHAGRMRGLVADASADPAPVCLERIPPPEKTPERKCEDLTGRRKS